MQGISQCVWFDNQAEEAADYYLSTFSRSRIVGVSRYGEEGAKVSGREKGSVMTVTFELEGEEFIALNGGPLFALTPAISFFVSCGTNEEIDRLWARLSTGGSILMELGKYPFSEKYGWIKDRFGVTWQLNLARRGQKIAPFMMFVGEQHGKAEEAMNRYISLFKNSRAITVVRYGAGEDEPEGTLKHAAFSLDGQEFMAMDSGREHGFTFTPALSLMVKCPTQAEVDELWARLTDGGEEQQCGWLKDRYGVSWQIVPTALGEMLNQTDARKKEKVMKALFQMRRIDIQTLTRASE